MRSSRRGFTLIELLVVIAIIAVLIGLLLPAVQAAREAARRAQCVNNLKQLSLAAHNYHDQMGSFPANLYLHPSYSTPTYTWNAASWMVMMLPQMEQSPLYNAVNFSVQWGAPEINQTVRETIVNGFLCPSDPSASIDTFNADEIGSRRAAGTSYVGNVGDNCLNCSPMPDPGLVAICNTTQYRCRGFQLGDPKPTSPPTTPPPPGSGSGIFWRQCNGVSLREVTDGTSNTLMIGEQLMGVTNWNAWVHANQTVGSTAIPLNYLAPGRAIRGGGSVVVSTGAHDRGSWPNWYSFRSQHPGGGNFAMCDGSVKFLKTQINFPIYQALSTRSQSEVVSSDAF